MRSTGVLEINPMRAHALKHGLLLGLLDRDEAHVGPTNCVADGCRVVAVVLAGTLLVAFRLEAEIPADHSLQLCR